MKTVFYLLLFWRASAQNCPKNLTIDISDGRFDKDTKSLIYENVTYPLGKYFQVGDKVEGCICELKTCVNFCCSSGQAMIDGLDGFECVNHTWEPKIDTLLKEEANFHIIKFKLISNCAALLLDPEKYVQDAYYFQNDGTLYMPHSKSTLSFDRYCVTRFLNESATRALICHISEGSSGVEQIFKAGMIISMPFLLATLIVFALLPDKKYIYTKCQMAYVVSLLCAYFTLVYLQFSEALSQGPCLLLGLLCSYFFMTSFFWMNISCINIFLTFSGKRGFTLQKHSDQIKRFAAYCIYAYGAPLIIIIITLVLNTKTHKNRWYYPNLGDEKCWFAEGFPVLLYFYGPMGALILANMSLFIMTALKIRQISKDTAMLRADSKKHYENDKQTYNLYMKLLIAMGINWSLEFTSWLVDTLLAENKVPQIWYFTDLCNALYGVFIFYLFVCKKSTWIMLQKRYYNWMGQHQKARDLSTRASNYSTSDTEKINIDETVVSSKV